MKHGLLFCTILLFSLPVYAAKRVALVMGNSDYKNLTSLNNLQADATAIAQQLNAFGFTLIRPVRKTSDVQYNLNEDELIIARDALINAAAGAEMAFLYYSGHGASLGKRLEAHIIPVNVARPTQEATSLALLQRHSLSLDGLLTGLDQQAALTIAVFDACREIPELAKTKSLFGSGQWRGLGRVKNGRKRIIAYSGSQGQVVADGEGRYSPYTARLLEVLKNNSSQEIGNLFRDVATKVEGYTQQTAEVLIQGVPPNQYYFTPPVVQQPQQAAAPTVRITPTASVESTTDEEDALWTGVNKCNEPSCYRAYISQYPQGKYYALAKDKLGLFTAVEAARDVDNSTSAREDALWVGVKKCDKPSCYHAYISRYPQGKYSALAEDRLGMTK